MSANPHNPGDEPANITFSVPELDTWFFDKNDPSSSNAREKAKPKRKTKSTSNPKPRRTSQNRNSPTSPLYQVIIHCQSEAEQRQLFERLRSEGKTCRLVVL